VLRRAGDDSHERAGGGAAGGLSAEPANAHGPLFGTFVLLSSTALTNTY
jgi:hypothetical protein